VVAAIFTFLAIRLAGRPADEGLRLLRTSLGLVVFLDVVANPDATVTEAHDLARRLEQEIRESQSEIADVVVHTEP
jgi:divalent metal cation (Fe/Co/Zn/Cd) transporter